MLENYYVLTIARKFYLHSFTTVAADEIEHNHGGGGGCTNSPTALTPSVTAKAVCALPNWLSNLEPVTSHQET